jgi:sterol desaturase/sphingolipid hydroxylase (fatty acid hydroxylase superfamily)
VIYVLGFPKHVMDVYIIIVGFQAVFNHANVRLPRFFSRAPLKYLVVTPDFHHWHHSSEREALDRNYAAHFAFIDYLFGTAVKSDRRFPEKYGVLRAERRRSLRRAPIPRPNRSGPVATTPANQQANRSLPDRPLARPRTHW